MSSKLLYMKKLTIVSAALLFGSFPINVSADEQKDNISSSLDYEQTLAVSTLAEDVESEEIIESTEDDEETSIDTIWVYDETNSLSQETINYINELNNNELKDYQYAVYITSSIYGDMDTFKLNLFNDLGIGSPELNSGVLFVLATEDREYGIEIGDGLQGRAREMFNDDIVGEVSISELKAGDWDAAVMKVSQSVPKIIGMGSTEMSSEIDELSDEEAMEAFNANVRIIKNQMLVFLIVTLMVIFIIIVLKLLLEFAFMMSSRKDLNKFIKKECTQNFLRINNLDKDELKSFIKENYSSYCLYDESILYTYTLESILDSLNREIDEEVDESLVREDMFSEEYYNEHEKETLKSHITMTVERYQSHIREERRKQHEIKKLREQNNEWLKKTLYDGTLDDDRILKLAQKELLSNDGEPLKTKKDIDKWIFSSKRRFELEDEVDNLFSADDARAIKRDMKKEGGYKRYVSGESNEFIPSSEEREKNYYNKRENKAIDPGLYWLWLYGMNNNSIRREEAVRRRVYKERAEELERERKERERRKSSSSSHSNFGSGFGGGFSSGGGSSGSF